MANTYLTRTPSSNATSRKTFTCINVVKKK